ncbi:type II secretion system protein F [Rothia nasimurium]|uniref:Type II secretion system protein F n=2 Tax=Rothia nasimurium TaxID=85336 RepID=A0A1Y1RQQ5_9MICC|nr:type II secretion system protein F [Rothia nasimurium]
MRFALLLSLTLSAGIWLITTSLMTQRTQSFANRIAPQLRAAEFKRQAGDATYTTLPEGLYGALLAVVEPWSDKLFKTWGASSFDSTALNRRLEQLGGSLSSGEYRIQQLLWSIAGLGLAVVFVALGAAQGKISIVSGILLMSLGGFIGFLGRDYWLTHEIKKREKAMLAEFPALAELMALSVTAGESAVGALERVVRSSRGELSKEFRSILSMTRSGEPLVSALQSFSQRTSVAALSRFVDGLVVAIERGTPLADVLRAQAQDVRDNAKRELMETAGKKEIGMMAPVVFLILPLTVLFAMFPGISLLNLNF